MSNLEIAFYFGGLYASLSCAAQFRDWRFLLITVAVVAVAWSRAKRVDSNG